MSIELRRFPRVPYRAPAELEMHSRHLDPSSEKVRVPVELFSMSCEGVGLSVSDTSTLIPGSQVRINFAAGADAVELPARVVWAAGPRAGLRLRLAGVDEATRHAFASWIVPLTNKAIKRARN